MMISVINTRTVIVLLLRNVFQMIIILRLKTPLIVSTPVPDFSIVHLQHFLIIKPNRSAASKGGIPRADGN